jgi:2-polyprenyl-6-methoxyphenol hydroxylase-like FAD-dependent oxidoreductase
VARETFDVIIVGARCAGATTALALARRGLRVLVLDRARFPSDTLSTHNFSRETTARFRDLGLLDAIRATGAPPIRGMRLVAPRLVLRSQTAIRPWTVSTRVTACAACCWMRSSCGPPARPARRCVRHRL